MTDFVKSKTAKGFMPAIHAAILHHIVMFMVP